MGCAMLITRRTCTYWLIFIGLADCTTGLGALTKCNRTIYYCDVFSNIRKLCYYFFYNEFFLIKRAMNYGTK